MAQTGQRRLDYSRPLSEQIALPKMKLEDQLFLAKHQKKNVNLVGKIWNAPNTALGLAYGGLGYLVGKVRGDDPEVSIGGNAIRFTNNPFGGVGAITLGNTTTYSPDFDPEDPDKNGVPVWIHEEDGHTRQGEQLGPLYLPSNILGGMLGLLFDRDWHGPHNWNETGPLMNPPRAWPSR